MSSIQFDSLLLRIYQNNTECGVQRKPLQHNTTRIKNQLLYKFTDKHKFVGNPIILIRVQSCKDLYNKQCNSALAQQQQTTHSLLSCCCLQNPKCSYYSHQSTKVRVFVFCVILYLAKKEKTCKFRNHSLCLGLNDFLFGQRSIKLTREHQLWHIIVKRKAIHSIVVVNCICIK